MELIKSVARRSQVSDIIYVTLNIALALAILVMTVAFQPPILAYLLVLLSKWRVFAVRPRFWWANLQTNMVDVLVGFSVVTLIWQASGALIAQILLAVLFVAWLLVIKPRSSRRYVVLQAGLAQFFALAALFSGAHVFDSAIVVAICFLIGFVSARHVLTAYEDTHVTLLSAVWGFFLAELGWLGYHWVVAYGVVENLMLPQIAIIAGLAGFVTIRFIDAAAHGHKLSSHLRAPMLFAGAVLAILLLRELSGIFNYTS